MNDTFLEQYYENVILPQYGNEAGFKTVSWKDHGKIDLDAWAHFFENENGREYALVYEDFPGDTFLNDNLTHDVVKAGEERSICVSVEPGGQIDNVAGHFTLYREKRR